jgi:pyruvate/2-oxoglutarate dehydrogenase complex dihydrolipoamide acyltransferase (E2) component
MPETRLVAVRLPRWGLTMEDAVVVEWMVGEGEQIELGAALVTVETDKSTAEVEAPASGRLVRVAAREGDPVKAGDLLADIEVPG